MTRYGEHMPERCKSRKLTKNIWDVMNNYKFCILWEYFFKILHIWNVIFIQSYKFQDSTSPLSYNLPWNNCTMMFSNCKYNLEEEKI